MEILNILKNFEAVRLNPTYSDPSSTSEMLSPNLVSDLEVQLEIVKSFPIFHF